MDHWTFFLYRLGFHGCRAVRVKGVARRAEADGVRLRGLAWFSKATVEAREEARASGRGARRHRAKEA
jgi:hypothetical protein